MGIRTNTRRATALRRLVRIPLRSPWHLAATAVVAGLVAVTVGALLPDSPGPEHTRPAASTVARPPAPPRPAAADTQASDQKPVRELVTQVGRAWTTHPDGMTPEDFSKQFADLGTEEFVTELHATAPQRVPELKVLPEQMHAPQITGRIAVVRLPALREGDQRVLLRITAVKTPHPNAMQGWRVNQIEATPAGP